MEAETWHLPEYRCLAPSLRPVTEPYWLRTPQCKFEQRFLHGDGPAQVGLGSFEPHHLFSPGDVTKHPHGLSLVTV